MRFSDEVIASYLNEEWRTPPAVHRLLGSRGAVADIAYVLERLARAGKIEAKHEAAMTGRSGPPVLCIDYYRKLQKWPKSSVGKMPTSPTVTVTKGRQQPARKKPAPPPPPRAPESWILLVVVAGKMLADDLHSVFGFHFVEKPSAAQKTCAIHALVFREEGL